MGHNGASQQLIYRGDEREVLISTGIGRYSGVNSSFSWAIYGDNIIYMKVKGGGTTKYLLYVFSPEKGNVLIDKDANYWTIKSNTEGVFCYPYVDGNIDEKIDPVVYSAAFISSQ